MAHQTNSRAHTSKLCTITTLTKPNCEKGLAAEGDSSAGGKKHGGDVVFRQHGLCRCAFRQRDFSSSGKVFVGVVFRQSGLRQCGLSSE